MIVNSEYMYMGRGPKPANPVIFSGTTINYAYDNLVNANFNDSGLRFNGTSEVNFLEIDASTFTTITFKGRHPYSRSLYMYVKMTDSSGNETSASRLPFAKGQLTTVSWDIPEQFRKSGLKLVLYTNNNSELNIYSAILS